MYFIEVKIYHMYFYLLSVKLKMTLSQFLHECQLLYSFYPALITMGIEYYIDVFIKSKYKLRKDD